MSARLPAGQVIVVTGASSGLFAPGSDLNAGRNIWQGVPHST